MASATHVKNTALGIHASAPRLTTGLHLSPSLRDQLEELGQLCGLSMDTARKASDNDLISIYLVAMKDGAGGPRVAQRVNLRHNAPRDILDTPDVVPARPNPAWPRKEPKPEPTYYDADLKPEPKPRPAEAAGPSLDTVRDLIKREVREGALEPLQTAIGTVHDELSEAIARVPLDAAEASLAAMRAEMGTMAHTAALEALKTLTPTRLEVTRPDAPSPVSLGLVHKQTPLVLAALTAGVNVYLYGPAGSGKTTLAEKVAQAFGLKAYYAAKVESEYQLLGFKDAKGDTVRTQFRDAYEHGGVFLFDELDGSAPSAVVALNMALANGVCPFPDGMVPRHEKFVCIAAGNTKLTGATRQYAGRNQLDAASIDRFAFIEFGYDDDLELALASDQSWAKYVQRVRAVVAERGLSHLVTPRATYDGCKLLAQGIDRTTVAGLVVYKGLDADTVRQIEQAL
jgi:hypothetical protein